MHSSSTPHFKKCGRLISQLPKDRRPCHFLLRLARCHRFYSLPPHCQTTQWKKSPRYRTVCAAAVQTRDYNYKQCDAPGERSQPANCLSDIYLDKLISNVSAWINPRLVPLMCQSLWRRMSILGTKGGEGEGAGGSISKVFGWSNEQRKRREQKIIFCFIGAM